jgi:hypothetical protein
MVAILILLFILKLEISFWFLYNFKCFFFYKRRGFWGIVFSSHGDSAR